MKLIFTILFLCSVAHGQTIYHVKNSGNDANDGLTDATAWQTLSKVNSYSFSSGDSVLLKSGDSWHEKLIVPNSNLNFGSYGTGNKPLITGLVTATGWTNIGGNLWQTTATGAPDSLNTVLIDGKIRAKGRYPNTGYLTFISRSGDSSITGSLTGTPNYTGAECVVRTAAWVIDVVHISSQSAGTLNFTPQHLTYPSSQGGNGYFIQNSIYALDLQYEWYETDTAKNFIIYSATSPNAQYSTIDTLVWLNNKSNISFSNLSIQGANKAAIQIDTCNTVTIQNCSINNSGRIGISGLKSPHVSILNDSIQNSLSGGIYMRQVDPYTPTVNTCDSAVISGNYIHNTGIFAGMGMNSNGRYEGIFLIGLDGVISNNEVDSTGYAAIFFNGKRTLVKNNYVHNFAFVKDDCGAIYTVVGGYLPADYNDSSVVISNIVTNGIGAKAGTNVTWNYASGIYADDGCRYLTIDSNTVSNTDNGIFTHNNSLITVTNNKLYKNRVSEFTLWPTANVAQSLIYKYNQSYSDSVDHLIYEFYNLSTSNIGVSDSNYFSHPNYESSIVYYYNTDRSLSSWQSFSGQDLNSHGTPSNVTSVTALLKYNTSDTVQTFALDGYYTDMEGNFYNNSITVQPFQSAVLFKSTNFPKYSLRFKRISQK